MSKQDDFFGEEGTNNMSADLAFAESGFHSLKAKFVAQIADVAKRRKMNQTALAQAVGTTPPMISRILRGQLHGVSVERLMRMLTMLDCTVDIVLHPGPPALTTVIHLSESNSELFCVTL